MPDIDPKTEKGKEEEGNLYTNIFEKKSKAEEIKEAPQETQLIEGVFDKKEKEKKPEEKILGPMPELEKKIIGAFDPTRRNLKIARFFFFLIISFSLISIGFFYAELNENFDLLTDLRGPNAAQRLTNSKQDIIATKTSINQKNYLLMASYLQELSYLSDNYAKSRNDAIPASDLAVMQEEILTSYSNAQIKFKEPIKVANIDETEFKNALKNELKSEISTLQKETLTQPVLQEINLYSAALSLVNNTKLSSFLNRNTDDLRAELANDDTKLFDLTQQALSILNNEFSNVSLIKQDRIQWSVIVNEIEKVTKSVDNLYNSGFYEELGGIKYSAFDFDVENNRIILIGEAKRDDGTTFTLIANLIDTLEQSSLFSQVDNRQYPKSGTDEQGYTSNFRIELQLEENYLIAAN